MTKEELLKIKCQHELCLIGLLEHFEEVEKKVDGRKLKQYFRGLQDYLRNYLNLENTDNSKIDNIFKRIKMMEVNND